MADGHGQPRGLGGGFGHGLGDGGFIAGPALVEDLGMGQAMRDLEGQEPVLNGHQPVGRGAPDPAEGPPDPQVHVAFGHGPVLRPLPAGHNRRVSDRVPEEGGRDG